MNAGLALNRLCRYSEVNGKWKSENTEEGDPGLEVVDRIEESVLLHEIQRLVYAQPEIVQWALHGICWGSQ